MAVANESPDFNEKKGFWQRKSFSSRAIVGLLSLLAVLMIFIIILMVVFMVKNHHFVVLDKNSTRNCKSEDGSILTNDGTAITATMAGITKNHTIQVIPRLEWLAQPPVHLPNNLTLPVPYVIVLHTATRPCINKTECLQLVRLIQTFHIVRRNWWDIGYNFLIGGDGYVYEGRGWKAEGAHTYSYNEKNIGITFIGNFKNVKPSKKEILAFKALIKLGVELGYVSKNYKLFAHRQLQTTQSQGLSLYEELKTWDHWAGIP